MTRPLDSRAGGPGFDGPPDERTKGIDVIGNAESVIIPSIRELLRINAKTSSSQNWEQEERKKRRVYAQTVRERLATPLWGELDILQASRIRSADANFRHHLAGKDIRGKEILRDRKGVSLQGCVAVTEGPILAQAKRPTITNSLLVGGMVLCGSNNNNSPFNPDQLSLMSQLGNAIQESDKSKVLEVLSQLESHVENYDRNMYAGHGEEEAEYERRYGELATIASVVDNRYLDLLQGGEATDVDIDNSVLLGLSNRILGGTIRNSVIAASHNPLANAHVDVVNCYLVSGSHNINVVYIEKGKLGNSQGAKNAVAAVRDLPPNPLLSI